MPLSGSLCFLKISRVSERSTRSTSRAILTHRKPAKLQPKPKIFRSKDRTPTWASNYSTFLSSDRWRVGLDIASDCVIESPEAGVSKVLEGHHPRGTPLCEAPEQIRVSEVFSEASGGGLFEGSVGLCGVLQQSMGFSGGSDPTLVTLRNCWMCVFVFQSRWSLHPLSILHGQLPRTSFRTFRIWGSKPCNDCDVHN